VARWSGSENEPQAVWARKEIERLDLLFSNRQLVDEEIPKMTAQGQEVANPNPAVIPSTVSEGAVSSAPE
jgi:hypothetical protein